MEELDWVILHSTPPRLRIRHSPAIDLLLIVDCIYHPSLLPALVETLDSLTVPELTTVLVVVELRAEDVIRTFLELWLAKPHWEIWRLGRHGALGKPYVMWSGRKHEAAS